MSNQHTNVATHLDNFIHIPEYSFGENKSGNLIIQGDNNIAINLLYEKYINKVKCIYIDPPYNNGEDYIHYNDNNSHKKWLNGIILTLKKLKPLLSTDGSLWMSIDEKEMHYLKVYADEVFGRQNFITTIVWQQRATRENRKVFSNNHEYILVYAKDPKAFKKARNLLPPTEEVLKRYKNPDNDDRGVWQSVSVNVQAGHAVDNQFYEVVAPNGKKHAPPPGRCWAYNETRMKKEIENNNIWFGNDGNGVPRIKKFLHAKHIGLTPETLWLADFAGTNKIAKKHLLQLFSDSPVFDTPKPEQLIKRIFEIATNENDLVLDCFLGSGTSTAVAQKMNRNYIGIEKGSHIKDIVVQRMKKVIEGEQGGISADILWKGGGGYEFYQLAH